MPHTLCCFPLNFSVQSLEEKFYFKEDFNVLKCILFFFFFFNSEQNLQNLKAWFHKMISDFGVWKDMQFLGESGFQDLSQFINKFSLNVWSVTVLEKLFGRKPNKLSSKHCQISGTTLSELYSPYKWFDCDQIINEVRISEYFWAALLLISKSTLSFLSPSFHCCHLLNRNSKILPSHHFVLFLPGFPNCFSSDHLLELF